MSTFTQYLTQFNIYRRRAFGYSAPVVTAAATVGLLGWAVPAATQYVRGAPVIFEMKVVIGTAVVVALVTELGFHFLGKDEGVLVAANVESLGNIGEAIISNPDVRRSYAAISGRTEGEVLEFGHVLVAAAKKNEPAAEENASAPKAGHKAGAGSGA